MEEKLGFKELVCKAATQVRRVGLEEGTGEKVRAGLDTEERGAWTEN